MIQANRAKKVQYEIVWEFQCGAVTMDLVKILGFLGK